MIEGAVQILLIEDNLEHSNRVLKAVRRRKLANWIQVARSGTEALEFLFRNGAYARRSNHNPRLILLDLKLPDGNGLEVLRRIKVEPTTRSIPVVILTSSREERDIVESYHLGVNSYIVKPVDRERFAEVVQHLAFYWLILNQPPEVGGIA
jgi:two-component system, response regulator